DGGADGRPRPWERPATGHRWPWRRRWRLGEPRLDEGPLQPGFRDEPAALGACAAPEALTGAHVRHRVGLRIRVEVLDERAVSVRTRHAIHDAVARAEISRRSRPSRRVRRPAEDLGEVAAKLDERPERRSVTAFTLAFD